MAFSYTHMIDLFDVKLSENADEIVWLQAMPMGIYDHPQHGEIVFDETRVKNFADNVNNKTRTTDLDIDYEHKEYSGEAAGWVKAAEARPDGLFISVDFTPKARQMLKDKEYRYFSPEFMDEWTHPKTKVTHKDVLFGGGITNRPFLKDIQPLTFKEPIKPTGLSDDTSKGGKNVTDEERKAKALELGLEETATSDEILAHMIANPVVPADTSNSTEGGDLSSIQDTAGADDLVSASLREAATALSEKNPEFKSFSDLMIAQLEASEKKLAETTTALRFTDITNAVKLLNEKLKNKNHTVTPVLQKKLSDFLLSLPTKALSDSALVILSEIVDMAAVKLGENGKTPETDRKELSDGHKFYDLVTAKAKTDGISVADATKELSDTHPDLFKAYREENSQFNA